MAWVDESALDGKWTAGAIWTVGETGIWIGLPGLFIGIGSSFRSGSYSDESVETSLWSD